MSKRIGLVKKVFLATTGMAAVVAPVCIAAPPQAAPAPLAFEVASVKVRESPRGQPPPGPIFDFSSSGPRATWAAFPLMGLIAEAYNVRNYQLSVAPSAERSGFDTYYDIVAKAEGEEPRTRSEFRQMLQALLAERFNLQVHHERKEMPVYALIVGRNGPKFKESAPGADPIARHGVNGRNQTINAPQYTTAQLAAALTVYVPADRPVVDMTGLTGTYDIKFEATPAFRLSNDAQFGDIDAFSAVQDQLGLKLEKQTAMVEILIVDQVEKPSPDE
jgi:uncharacterized protein (TIGR03435 family)